MSLDPSSWDVRERFVAMRPVFVAYATSASLRNAVVVPHC